MAGGGGGGGRGGTRQLKKASLLLEIQCHLLPQHCPGHLPPPEQRVDGNWLPPVPTSRLPQGLLCSVGSLAEKTELRAWCHIPVLEKMVLGERENARHCWWAES